MSLEKDKNEDLKTKGVIRGDVGMTRIQHSTFHQPRLKFAFAFCRVEGFGSSTCHASSKRGVFHISV